MDTDHHACDSPTVQRHPELEKPLAERATERHSDRPPELEIFEAGSYDPPVCSGQLAKPLQDGFRAGLGTEEDEGDAFLGIGHDAGVYQ